MFPGGVAERVTRPSEGQEGGHVTGAETGSCLEAVTQIQTNIRVSEVPLALTPMCFLCTIQFTLQWKWNSPASPSPKHPPNSYHIRTAGKQGEH